MPAQPPSPAPLDHDRPPIVVCGVDHLGLRTIEELGIGEERVVAIGAHEDPAWATHHPDVRLVVGDARLEETLGQAGVPIAAAIVLTGDDDLGNLNIALEAPGRRRLLAIVDPDGRVRRDPPADEILDAGESVLVAATRAGLAQFIDLARPPV
jgi:Trk K+ transport system NAD-binding subunit